MPIVLYCEWTKSREVARFHIPKCWRAALWMVKTRGNWTSRPHPSLSRSLFVVVDAFVCCGEFGISSLGDGDKDVCVAAHCLVICDLCIRFADYVKLAFNRQFWFPLNLSFIHKGCVKKETLVFDDLFFPAAIGPWMLASGSSN
jgi:hypothetical protein